MGVHWANIPGASTRAVFLHLLWVYIGKTVLTKETRDSFRGECGSLGNTLVVTVVGLVRSGHCEQYLLVPWQDKEVVIG